MAKHLITLGVLAMAAVCGGRSLSAAPEQPITAAKSIAIVCALEPGFAGQKFSNTGAASGRWSEPDPGLDVNAAVLNAAKQYLNRDAKLVNGRDVGVVINRDGKAFASVASGAKKGGDFKTQLKARLVELGREWNVEYVLVVHTVQSKDFVRNTSNLLSGVGHLDAMFGTAFCALQMQVFDCTTGTLTPGPVAQRVRKLPDILWHSRWSEYSPEDRRGFLRILRLLMNETTGQLLTDLGMSRTPIKAPVPQGMRRDVRIPFIPEGNVIEIAPELSLQSGRAAVLNAFKEEQWNVTLDTPEKIAAVYRKEEKEAACTITFEGRKIVLVPEGFEYKEGQRVPVEVHSDWHEDIKEEIMLFLLKAPAENEAKTSASAL